MRSMKNIVIMISLVFLVLAASPIMGSRGGDFEDFKYEQLGKIAAKDGFVRVIVKMDVPDLEPLAEMSRSYMTGFCEDKGYVQAAADADTNLDTTISQVRDVMLHKLKGAPYIINRTFSTVPYVALTVYPETLEKLKAMPVVIDIFEDRLTPLPENMKTDAETTGDNIDEPFLQESVQIVGGDVAWGFGYTGANWYVAVFDTGIRSSHEMFRGKNIVEQCFSLGSNPNNPDKGGCPNGKREMSGVGSAAPYGPQYGHGTHVSGIATGNNGVDRFGVAKDAGLIHVQVFSYIPEWASVGSYDADTAKALEYIYSIRNVYNIASINMSLGSQESYSGFCNDFRKDLIDNLRAAGIATVIASGNEGQCNATAAPGCVEGAVTVNGTDKMDGEYMFGNWHDTIVDLMAPGAYISSSTAWTDTTYEAYSGTSMATPHVAGAWAIFKQFDPTLSVGDILLALQETGTMISSGRCPARIAKPRINIGDGLAILFSIAPPRNLSAKQVKNQSLLQLEYINELSWDTNPRNEGKNVTNYRIYLVENNQKIFLGEVDSNTFKFWHRNAGKRVVRTYAITAKNSDGEESPPYYHTIEFGVEQ